MTTLVRRVARRWPVVLTIVGLIVVVGGYLRAIIAAERILSDGTVVLLALAPRDPRAFLTGDYMIINLAVANRLSAVAHATDEDERRTDGYVIVAPDRDGVAQLLRFADRASGLAAGELALVARHRGAGWRIGTDAFYFSEGQGARYEAARFGEYRLSSQGELLLVRLLDERFRPLPVSAEGVTD